MTPTSISSARTARPSAGQHVWLMMIPTLQCTPGGRGRNRNAGARSLERQAWTVLALPHPQNLRSCHRARATPKARTASPRRHAARKLVRSRPVRGRGGGADFPALKRRVGAYWVDALLGFSTAEAAYAPIASANTLMCRSRGTTLGGSATPGSTASDRPRPLRRLAARRAFSSASASRRKRSCSRSSRAQFGRLTGDQSFVNGFGRLRPLVARRPRAPIASRAVAINDLADAHSNACVPARFVHGAYPGEVHARRHDLIVDWQAHQCDRERGLAAR